LVDIQVADCKTAAVKDTCERFPGFLEIVGYRYPFFRQLYV
jgi:hypothetical protein